MKYLTLIKALFGIILIIFGMYFGILIANESRNSGLVSRISFVAGPAGSGITSTYSPIYAGICILAGVYLLAKVKSE